MEHGGAEDVEKRQSSRAAGSPSFSRMRPQLPSRKIQRRQHGDIEAKSREVQIRLEAANTSQNTAVGSSSPTISLNKQHSPRPWTAPHRSARPFLAKCSLARACRPTTIGTRGSSSMRARSSTRLRRARCSRASLAVSSMRTSRCTASVTSVWRTRRCTPSLSLHT